MIELDIKVNNSHKLNIIWDGIIISTPAWSTWYNHSLCWPILPHNLNAFVITPKAPWKPKFQSPIILDDEIIVNILNTWRINPIEIYSDWVLVKNFKDESINLKIKKSKYKITLLSSKETNDNFDNKVLEEQGFINL
jgi:NAD kinase